MPRPKKDQQTLNQVSELLAAGKGRTEIAKTLGTSVDALSGIITRNKLGKRASAEVSGAESKEEYWRRESVRLSSELSKARAVKTGAEVLVDIAHELAPKSYQPAPFSYTKTPKHKSSPQTAVLMFSDTHCGQVIDADQTLGFGNYGFPQFLRRLRRLETGIISIRQDHTTMPIDKLVVAMIGDMIHGNLAHSVEAGQANTLFTQFYCAGHAIAQFLRNLSPYFPSVEIETAVGNHPRWSTQHKMPTDNRYSNLDMFLYAYVQALTKDVPSIKWNLDKQPFALFDVQGFTFFAGHGDHLRGGDKALGIPNHAIARQVSTTSQLFSKAGRKAPNYYLFGHFHRPITLPHAQGEVIINGGFPGMDGFGLMNSFNPCAPSQKFFFVHPGYGRSACYDLLLEGFKGIPDQKPYSVPFPVL
jgi:hypothetical protein